MNFKSNHFYREGSFHHLYIKALNGNVLFYRIEDYLFIYTIVSVLAKRHNVIIELFCIMFNHLHGCVRAYSEGEFRSFLRDLSSVFTKGYNQEYHLSGPLLMPCGYVPKTSGKYHKTCLIYIANNPSAGRLVNSVMDYKWGLIPYFFSDHPFSEKLVKRQSRFAMRQALAIADRCHKRGQILNYATLKRIFKNLNSFERAQMVDYIIVKYFFLDKKSFISHYGDLDKAILTIDS
jgi:REP element-mobilizing transposase RayT